MSDDLKLNKYENIIKTNNFLLISLIILAILKKIDDYAEKREKAAIANP